MDSDSDLIPISILLLLTRTFLNRKSKLYNSCMKVIQSLLLHLLMQILPLSSRLLFHQLFAQEPALLNASMQDHAQTLPQRSDLSGSHSVTLLSTVSPFKATSKKTHQSYCVISNSFKELETLLDLELHGSRPTSPHLILTTTKCLGDSHPYHMDQSTDLFSIKLIENAIYS